LQENCSLRNPFCISDDSRIVREVKKNLSNVIGIPPSYIGHHWWEDSALFSEAGIDTVIIGPKGEGIHQKVEWVDIQSVENLASVLALTATNYCRESKV
jgi:acetylornithine deacetylase